MKVLQESEEANAQSEVFTTEAAEAAETSDVDRCDAVCNLRSMINFCWKLIWQWRVSPIARKAQ